MAAVTAEYQKLVLDDLKNSEGLVHPVKSSVLAQLLVRKVSPRKLHPNPADEFSMPDIGPNYGIVSNYEQAFRTALHHDENPFKESLVIEKLSSGGYRLLNGHHRWMAACRVGMKRVPVELVNPTHEEDVFAAITLSDKQVVVSFDLDEVLLANDAHPAGKKLPFPVNAIFKHQLRDNAGTLIFALTQLGLDVWIYTGSYLSENYLRRLFALYGAKPTGFITGVRPGRTSHKIRAAFREKYRISIHIDNEGLTVVDTRTHDYETVDFSSEMGWANEAITRIRALPSLSTAKG